MTNEERIVINRIVSYMGRYHIFRFNMTQNNKYVIYTYIIFGQSIEKVSTINRRMEGCMHFKSEANILLSLHERA